LRAYGQLAALNKIQFVIGSVELTIDQRTVNGYRPGNCRIHNKRLAANS
jgi:hypothetical protein